MEHQPTTRCVDTSCDNRTSLHSADIERGTEWRNTKANDPASPELAHADRVAILGRLIASIVHEVTQPIAATVVNAQTALRWLDDDPPDLTEVRRALTRIVRDGNRAADVVDRTRNLIRKAPSRRDRLDINEAIREVIELTRVETAKNNISVQLELANGLPLVTGDRVQLQQVILNLIVNAIDAMSRVSDGTRDLDICTKETESRGVLVTVRDSGPGLGSESIERVFETFYTTKHSGLGMGLPISRSIIEAHGGRMWASAKVPRGAIFEFTLPARPDLLTDVPTGCALFFGKTATAPTDTAAAGNILRHPRRHTAIAADRLRSTEQEKDSPAHWQRKDGSSPKAPLQSGRTR